MQVRLYLLGTPRLEVAGKAIDVTLRKVLALVVYLAVTRQAHSRDRLATLLWPDKDQTTARANLRRTLHVVGQLLGEQVLAVEADKVGVQAQADLWLDSEQFEQDTAACLPTMPVAAHALDPACLAVLAGAADLYQADFLAGFTLPDCPEFDEWQFFQREELRSMYGRVLACLGQAYAAQGDWEVALRYTRRLLALDPLEEATHRQLMALYAQAGQMGAALRQYEACVRILADELDVAPEAETTALYAAIRARRFPATAQTGAQPSPQLSDLSVPTLVLPTSEAPQPVAPQAALAPQLAHTLPPQSTPFVGRQQELAEVLRRLCDPACRMLTLVGPGGIGKTRLAVEAAQTLAAHNGDEGLVTLRHGCVFVPLQPVNAPSGIVPAIAGTLGLQFYHGAPPPQQLLHFLRDKELLLVLDNFEHLLDGAELVGEILAAAPQVKLLVTSREALKLQEEWFHPLAGMRLPPSVQSLRADVPAPLGLQAVLANADAVQLFVQTAQRAVVTFAPEAELAHIVRICRLVDGMPLGIELAASWLRVLPCAAIAAEIEHSIDILVARHQNVPARHRSMRAVLEQSWALLDTDSQRALCRFSVFQGGFLQDAALAVGANLLVLADLLDKSWLYRAPNGRYQMHELLRQYAADRLVEIPSEEAEAQARHAVFYLHLIAQRETALIGAGQRAALDEIDAEIDNIQAAWQSAMTQHRFDLVDRALHAIYLFFHTRSRYAEGEELFRYALQQLADATVDDAPPEMTSLRHRLLARLGSLHLYQGDPEAANRCFGEVLRNCQDPRELAFTYAGYGKTARQLGDRAAAEAALQQSLALARAHDDRIQMAEALKVLSDIASSWADYAAGKQYAEEGVALCRELQHPNLTAQVVAALAWANNCLGAYAESERYYLESLEIFEAIANPFGIALATNFLGWCAFCAGDSRLADALALHDQAIAIWRQIGQRSNLAMALADYALAACEAGEFTAALLYAQEGLAITEEIGYPDLESYNLYCLGAAACGLNDLAASRRYLLRSLQTACRLEIPDNISATLYILAKLLVAESQLALSPADRLAKQTQALELLALVIAQRATWQVIRDYALRVQERVAQILPAEAATAAIMRGQQAEVAEVVAEILREAALPSGLATPASHEISDSPFM